MKTAMVKKLLACVLIVGSLAGLVVGCGSQPASEKAAADTAQQVASTEAAASTDNGQAEAKTITYWTWVPTDAQWKLCNDAFSKKYPSIKVDFWRGELPDYQKKLQVAMAAGEGPDVLGMQVGAMQKQYEKYLEPIKPLADSKWGSGWEDKLSAASVTQTVASDGTLIGLPINFTAQEFVLYNKALFDEAGVKNVPTTFDEWIAVNKQLAAKGIIPVAFGGKDGWHDVDLFKAISHQFGPGKVDEAEAGKLPWTDKVFVDTMGAIKKLFDQVFQKGALGVATYPDARDQYFYSRKAAMFPTGTWHVGYAVPPAGEKFGTKIENDETGAFILPKIGPSDPVAIAGVDTAIAINKDGKNKDAAWELFSFMAMDEGQQIMADTVQGSPSRKGITAKLDTVKFQSEKDAINFANKMVSEAKYKRQIDYPDLANALGVAVQDVAAGKPIEKALAEVQAVSDKIKR